jgi:exopolysaccharide biosynthesis polyprenyl glycosylphosphotransferase
MSGRLETPEPGADVQGPHLRVSARPHPARGEPASSPFLVESAPPRAVALRDHAYRGALLLADLMAALLVFGLNFAWFGDRGPMWTALVMPLILPAVSAASGLYRRDERVINKNTLEEAPVSFQASTVATVLAFLAESALLQPAIGAMVVAVTWLGLVLMVPVCRTLARAMTRTILPPERCLVLGDHEQSRRLAAKLGRDGPLNTRLAGVLPLPACEHGGAQQSTLTLERLAALVRTAHVDRVVVAVEAGNQQEALDTIQGAKTLGVKVTVLPRVLEVVGSSATYDYVDGMTVLGIPRFGLSRRSRLVKRASDVGGSTMAMVLFGWVIAVIALLVKLTSPGPVLFRQTRIGRDGRPFEMLKFRSMHDGAEDLKDELRDRNEAQGLFKITDDPRTTRVGRFLRRTSLDELPQLFNVLRGEMSLVGPRPLVPDEDRQIAGWHRCRLDLTPGMTGPWQILGSARIPLREMVTIDSLYVTNWSLWGDVKIMLRTLRCVASAVGR